MNTYQEFKGPIETYIGMIKKNESYSQRNADLSIKRYHIRELEDELKSKLSYKFDKKFEKVVLLIT